MWDLLPSHSKDEADSDMALFPFPPSRSLGPEHEKVARMLGFCASFTCTRGGEQRETVAIAHMVLTRLVSSASMILLATFRSKGYAIDAPVERARSGAPATGHVEKGGVDDGSLSLDQGQS